MTRNPFPIGCGALLVAVSHPVSIFDLHATMLHQLGIDHNRLTFKCQGLDARLTRIEGATVIEQVLA